MEITEERCVTKRKKTRIVERRFSAKEILETNSTGTDTA